MHFIHFTKQTKKPLFLKGAFCLRNAGTTEEGYRYIQNLPASSDKTITFPKIFPIIYLWTDNYSLSLCAYHIIRNKYNQISAAINIPRRSRGYFTCGAKRLFYRQRVPALLCQSVRASYFLLPVNGSVKFNVISSSSLSSLN